MRVEKGKKVLVLTFTHGRGPKLLKQSDSALESALINLCDFMAQAVKGTKTESSVCASAPPRKLVNFPGCPGLELKKKSDPGKVC